MSEAKRQIVEVNKNMGFDRQVSIHALNGGFVFTGPTGTKEIFTTFTALVDNMAHVFQLVEIEDKVSVEVSRE